MATLAVETSTATFAAALGDGGRVLARAALVGVPPSDRNLPALVGGLIADAGRSFREVDRVAVDVGPGNLTAVRTGVAYANGLAFALGAGVAAASSLELLAAQLAEAEPDTPVLCLRNAGAGRVYGGLFGPAGPPRHRYGPLREVVEALAGQLPELAVAGDFRPEAAQVLPYVLVKDTGICGPDVATLLRVTADRPVLDPTRQRAASPLTEASVLFGGAP